MAYFGLVGVAVKLVDISANYVQSGSVYTDTPLDSLKSDLTVTATYDNGNTLTVTNYTLSGTLTEGTSTITVAYNGKTDTFNVTVSNPYVAIWDFNSNTPLIDSINGYELSLPNGGTYVDETIDGVKYAKIGLSYTQYLRLPSDLVCDSSKTFQSISYIIDFKQLIDSNSYGYVMEIIGEFSGNPLSGSGHFLGITGNVNRAWWEVTNSSDYHNEVIDGRNSFNDSSITIKINKWNATTIWFSIYKNNELIFEQQTFHSIGNYTDIGASLGHNLSCLIRSLKVRIEQ